MGGGKIVNATHRNHNFRDYIVFNLDRAQTPRGVRPRFVLFPRRRRRAAQACKISPERACQEERKGKIARRRRKRKKLKWATWDTQKERERERERRRRSRWPRRTNPEPPRQTWIEFYRCRLPQATRRRRPRLRRCVRLVTWWRRGVMTFYDNVSKRRIVV